MKQQSFFSTETGKLSIAGIVILLAFPLIFFGVNTGLSALAYLGFIMIVVSLASAPIFAFIVNRTGKHKNL